MASSARQSNVLKPATFVFDVDGVFNSGQFLYTIEGKFAKIFGPHDNDGIKLLRPHLTIEAISADKRGWEITRKRIESDMEIPVRLVSEAERVTYFREKGNLPSCIYMGDGLYDIPIFRLVGYSIAPANALPLVKKAASFVTEARGGEGAVAEACLHVLEKFFEPFAF